MEDSMLRIIDDRVIRLFEQLYSAMLKDASFFVADAQILAALFTFLYMGILGYGMLSGDKKLEIMPILRPFAIGLVIIFWIPFLSVINAPLSGIENKARNKFILQNTEIQIIAEKRYALMDSVAHAMADVKVELDEGGEEVEDSWYSGITDIGSGFFKDAKSLYFRIQNQIRFMLKDTIEFICLSIFQIAVYGVLFIKTIFLFILAVLGPFSFAFSILPGYRDAYISWISRYISVYLYGTITYLVIWMSLNFVKFSMNFEIEFFTQLLNPQNGTREAALMLYMTSSTGADVTMYLVALIVGAMCILAVPVIATWIIPTSGAGQAIGKMAGAAKMGARAGF